MDSLQVAAFDGEVAGFGGAGAKDDGVEIGEEFFSREIAADFGVANELDALAFHEGKTALDDFALVELGIGNAVHEKAAGGAGASEAGAGLAGAVELGGAGRAGGAGPEAGAFPAGRFSGGSGVDPAF